MKRVKIKRRKAAVLSGVIIVIFFTAIFWGWQTGGAFFKRAEIDANARPVNEKPPGSDELQSQIQKEADNSIFRFKINTAPYFPASDEEGDWCIINSPENTFRLLVVVTDSEGKELYRSREIKPGGQEMTGALTVELAEGEHQATATAYAIDPENGKAVSSVETGLVITVGKESDPKDRL